MVLQHIKGLIDTFTDGNGRNHHDELGPAVSLVELEHRLDIDVSLAGTGLHFYIQAQTAQVVRQDLGLRDAPNALHSAHIRKQLLVVELYVSIAVTGIISLREQHTGCIFTKVAPVLETISGRLPSEDVHRTLDRIRLILLYFEVEFHAYRIFRMVSLEYAWNICSKLSATLSEERDLSRIMK